MSRSINNVNLSGRLVKDVVTKELPSGAKVASFTIAVNDSYKGSDGEYKEIVSFIDCDLFYKNDDYINDVLKKGNLVFVEGKIQQQKWQDAKTGENRSKIGIKVENFEAASNRGEQKQTTETVAVNQNKTSSKKTAVRNDDIPF